MADNEKVMRIDVAKLPPGPWKLEVLEWERDVVTLPNGERLRVVVPDIRFPGEADYLRGIAERCLIVRLTRGDAGLSGQAGEHRSEMLIEHIETDVTIENDGTRRELAMALGVAISIPNFLMKESDDGG